MKSALVPSPSCNWRKDQSNRDVLYLHCGNEKTVRQGVPATVVAGSAGGSGRVVVTRHHIHVVVTTWHADLRRTPHHAALHCTFTSSYNRSEIYNRPLVLRLTKHHLEIWFQLYVWSDHSHFMTKLIDRTSCIKANKEFGIFTTEN